MEGVPDDVKVLILSNLTLLDAVRTSLLNHSWRYLWPRLPCLNFDFALVNRKDLPIRRATVWYISWADRVLAQADAAALKELRIRHLLSKSYTPFVRNWMRFALTNHVEIIHIDLRDVRGNGYGGLLEDKQCKLPGDHYKDIDPSCFTSLKSLTLIHVGVDKEFVHLILSQCTRLTYMLLDYAGSSTDLKLNSLSLRRFKIDDPYRDGILTELCAPNLMSLDYYGGTLGIHKVSVPKLIDLSVGGCCGNGWPVFSYLQPFISYLPQLEKLELHKCRPLTLSSWNNIPQMVKLKSLTIGFECYPDMLCHDIVRLWKSCPNLEALTLKNYFYWDRSSESRAQQQRLLMDSVVYTSYSLKVLRLHSNPKYNLIDQQLVEYIVQNSPNLTKLIVRTDTPSRREPIGTRQPPHIIKAEEKKAMKKLGTKLPVGANLIVT